MFGRNRVPTDRRSPYLLTLGPHSFYWFSLEAPAVSVEPRPSGMEQPLPVLAADDSWQQLLKPGPRGRLEALLPAFLRRARWFGGKARQITRVRLFEAVPVPIDSVEEAVVTFLSVAYTQAEEETYLLPLAYSMGAAGERVQAHFSLPRWPGST